MEGFIFMKNKRIAALVCLFAFLMLSLNANASIFKRKVVVGGLFSVTGGWQSLGKASVAAMAIAARDVNAYLDKIGCNTEIVVYIENTQLDPEIALQKMKWMSMLGVRIFIGPQSSAELALLKPYADDHGLILISQSSTAGTLAVPNDSVFRLCPDDRLEGEAISALMYADGIRTMIPLWRDDAGNSGLRNATQSHFIKLGGKVHGGVQYGPSTADFAPVLTTLTGQVTEALSQNPGATVGIYLAAFDEVVAIFNLAKNNATLSSLRWYGSDGVALSNALLANPEAARFAAKTGYPNPIFGFDDGAADQWTPIAERIMDRVGYAPDPFALAVYDAVWLAAKTLGCRQSIFQVADFVQNALPDVAGHFFGATGWTALNEAGDRRYGDFDFWAILEVNGTLQWKLVARYKSIYGTLIRQ
jgi:branched-chain amino acid transport system substrate-binding protein